MKQSIVEKLTRLLCCATNLPESKERTIEDQPTDRQYDYNPQPEPEIEWNQIRPFTNHSCPSPTTDIDNANIYGRISNSNETLESDGVFSPVDDLYQNDPMSEELRERSRQEYLLKNRSKKKLTREKSSSMTNLSAPSKKTNKYPPTSNLLLIKSKSEFDILEREEQIEIDDIKAWCNSRSSQRTTERSVNSEHNMPQTPNRPRYSAEHHQQHISLYKQPMRTVPSPRIESNTNNVDYVAVNWEKTDQLRTG
ncbi:Oidioi.mRNA.OKI2018_I69.XSR.g15906.t1.cds [Oikopleura dioica]|uniref:Oidioi.mRNA.OKI2018_I69.XSR.g15906.t1.cds n=1 Tax=Oikopleura dioica TaxID=34765 RepID=A0ABN7SJH1_OIKDI|nr:Oidioi.mRNA.OKI2018_I69.XSR.g15906.t1.cds [Oikopleura dioica]